MNCPICDKPNRDIAIFCKNCGESVVAKSSEPLEKLVGMTQVKNQLNNLVKICEMLALRAKKTGVKVRPGMDMVITGNTGTGKTRLISVIQSLLYSSGIIKNPKAEIIDAVDYENFSKEENWEANIVKAKGGLLVIENAQKLVPQKESDDINKLDKLFKCMNDEWNNDPIVILSGLTGLNAFMNTNADIASRFEYHFRLNNFSASELSEICIHRLEETYNLKPGEATKEKLERVFKYAFRNQDEDFQFGNNGHFAVKKAEQIWQKAIQRDFSATTFEVDDITGKEFNERTYDEIMAQLDEFVGIDEIKTTVKKVINKINDEQQLTGSSTKPELEDHYLFLGNPGTGKTTIARIFADILAAIEVLPSGHLVEVSAKDLIAGYVGQTAQATADAVDKAMGGVLFIDEAYELAGNDFGKDAITTLLKLMEDKRGKFVCIAAGYSKEMADFLTTNSGLASRFNETINFRDYKPEELSEIFRRMAKKEKLTLDEEADKHLLNFFKKMYIARDKQKFGNARDVLNVLRAAIGNKSLRLQELRQKMEITREMISTLTREDIEGSENIKGKDLDTILAELDEYIGMDSVKKAIRDLATKLLFNQRKMERGQGDARLTNVHIALTGNPGTGKTTIANKLGEIFKAIGLLSSAKVVVKKPADLQSSIVNDTGVKTNKACDEAMGGVLLIDEAYGLGDDKGYARNTQQEAVDTLMTRMSEDAGKFVIIFAGYRTRIEQFIRNSNPGMDRRITSKLHIEDYTANELYDIFMLNARKNKDTLTVDACTILKKLISQIVDAKSENFGNAGEMVKLLEEAETRRAVRLMNLEDSGVTLTDEHYHIFEAEDIPYDAPKALVEEDIFKELNNLIGLNNVKETIREIADYIKVEREKAQALGKKFQGVGDHYLFVGNPGTGKTTVARIMADIFYTLDVLPTNKLVEVKREDLVIGYVGQTAPNTKEKVKSAIGGVFFIDEAYTLKSGGPNDFGQEATNTLLPMMLDYKGKMIFIAAGYPREIQEWIDSNSGLESRFTKTIHFEDYTGEEMAAIFRMKAVKDQLTLTPEADDIMANYFKALYDNRGRNFANAREVGNYFDLVKRQQSSRLKKRMALPDFNVEEYKVLLPEDVNQNQKSIFRHSPFG